jgi:hypothetical protein
MFRQNYLFYRNFFQYIDNHRPQKNNIKFIHCSMLMTGSIHLMCDKDVQILMKYEMEEQNLNKCN